MAAQHKVVQDYTEIILPVEFGIDELATVHQQVTSVPDKQEVHVDAHAVNSIDCAGCQWLLWLLLKAEQSGQQVTFGDVPECIDATMKTLGLGALWSTMTHQE